MAGGRGEATENTVRDFLSCNLRGKQLRTDQAWGCGFRQRKNTRCLFVRSSPLLCPASAAAVSDGGHGSRRPGGDGGARERHLLLAHHPVHPGQPPHPQGQEHAEFLPGLSSLQSHMSVLVLPPMWLAGLKAPTNSLTNCI